MNQSQGSYSRGPAHPATKPLPQRLDSLIAQRRLCGGESCKRKCHRHNRGIAFVRRNRKAASA